MTETMQMTFSLQVPDKIDAKEIAFMPISFTDKDLDKGLVTFQINNDQNMVFSINLKDMVVAVNGFITKIASTK